MINIIIPSAGRARRVLTSVDSAILYVPQSELTDYIANNPAVEIISHPDDQYKNLAEKRQGICDKFGNVFMIDDDIISVDRVYTGKEDKQPSKLTPLEIKSLIDATATAAVDAGCYLFGFNNSPNPKHYYAQKPISLTSYINACAFGLHSSQKLYFTHRTTAAESHWINLLNIYAHRKSWCDQRFHFRQKANSTFRCIGGQSEHRTLDTERADTIFLRRMFGQAVTLKKRKADCAAVHQYQREIKNPL